MAFATALRRHGQVIFALLQREEQLRRNNPLESLLELLEPVFLMGLMSLAWWFLRNKTSPLGGSPILFYATGFFAMYFFIYVSRRMKGSIETPKRRFPVEQRLDHILVHLILRIIDYSILGVIIFGGIYFWFAADALPYDLRPVLLACVAIVTFGFGWGILNITIGRIFKAWINIYPALNRGLLMVSGVLFVADFLEPAARYVLSFNPLLHIILLFRTGFYPSYPALTLDTTYLAHCCIFSVFIGLVLERLTRRSEAD